MVTVPPSDVLLSEPENTPIVATVGSLLVQVPPVTRSLSNVDDDGHIEVAPIIAEGGDLTVTVPVVADPQPLAYVITAEPAAIPVTTPVTGSTVAIDGEPLVQVPPVALFVSDKDEPTHIEPTPPIAAGYPFIVTTCDTGVPQGPV